MATPPWYELFNRLFDFELTLREPTLNLYVERRRSPALEIRQQIVEQPDRATKFFVSGSRGSGKSSELARLQGFLRDDYAAIGLDVYASAANITQVSGGELLFMMGAAACKLAEERWGHTVDAGARRELFEAFKGIAKQPRRLDLSRLIKGTAVIAGAAAGALGAPAAVAAPAASGAGPIAGAVAPSSVTLRPFGGLTGAFREGDPEIDRLASALALILRDIAVHIRPPVILVDGLDRLEEADPIRRLFLQTRLLDLPACPVVYNGPIALWAGTRDIALAGVPTFKVCPLPDIPVEAPVEGSAAVVDAGDIREGRALMRRAVALRLETLGLGVDDVFDEGAIDALISRSGGVLRELVRLVHKACRLAYRQEPVPQRVDEQLAARAFDEAAREETFFVAASAARVKELAAVARSGRPTGSPESLHLLLRGAILAYEDHIPWFRVHPYYRQLLAAP